MSTFVPERVPPFRGRYPYDQYATSKSGANFLLTAGLMADDIKELMVITNFDKPEEVNNYYTILILLVISLALQVTVMVLALVLLVKNSHKPPADDPDVYRGTHPHSAEDGNSPPSRNASFAQLEVSDISSDQVKPPESQSAHNERVRKHMQRINDTLSVVSLLLALFHIVRSAIGAPSVVYISNGDMSETYSNPERNNSSLNFNRVPRDTRNRFAQ